MSGHIYTCIHFCTDPYIDLKKIWSDSTSCVKTVSVYKEINSRLDETLTTYIPFGSLFVS